MFCISAVLKKRGGGSVALSIPIGEIPNRGDLPRAHLYGFPACVVPRDSDSFASRVTQINSLSSD